ncbi:uncharacterized protein LOC118732864 [Rhagoletis pomonella]|uniref:uncharacterized protein LOC118732864 n=1 Tax=Rhagoletis pomonella TaxID=28610 RepID=UPI0017852329|nr:uncharacterized protein LOC118732864 [Rhagoletis pomonella]
MRPIINYRSAPAYKLSKYLKTILKHKLELPNKYIVTNAADLYPKDLYPSIPTTETMDILFRILLGKTEKKIAKEIINTLKTTINQNYFRFNNKIYRQINGLGMGNPTSAILMEVFMQSLEEKYMEHLTTNLGVSFYARYVDDIICIITGDKKEQILDYLKEQHKNIAFTMDKEEKGKLNYLDLTIKINKTTNRLEYEIYRNPTATDTVIHETLLPPTTTQKRSI